MFLLTQIQTKDKQCYHISKYAVLPALKLYLVQVYHTKNLIYLSIHNQLLGIDHSLPQFTLIDYGQSSAISALFSLFTPTLTPIDFPNCTCYEDLLGGAKKSTI